MDNLSRTLLEDLKTEKAICKHDVELLIDLAFLRAQHVTTSELAVDLLKIHGGKTEALLWLKSTKEHMNQMLYLLALHVALEAEEQKQLNKD